MKRRTMLTITGLAAFVAAGLQPAQATTTDDFLPDDFVIGAWLVYRDKYVEKDGRVIDGKAGGISHSEGQGYGMLMAVRAGEKRDFKRIWDWTSANLYVRGDRLAAWKWDPASSPNVADANNATDGDLLIAWALSQASAKWGIDDYAAQSRMIVDEISKKAVIETAFGKVLVPGAAGFGSNDQEDGPVVNLSYWVFPAIADLGVSFPEFPAAELIRSGLDLTRLSRFGQSGLPANWISLKGSVPAPAAGYPALFGYDAIRIPLYVAWFSRDYPDILESFASAWSDPDTPEISVIDLQSGIGVSPMRDPGYAAVAELVSNSLGQKTSASQMTTFEPTDYYPSTLHILSLMALTERYPECLPNLQ